MKFEDILTDKRYWCDW